MKSVGASIRLVRLVKRFGTVSAVDDISMDICEGEFVTILGPSGSGKTTTLNLIAGFETPTSGKILIGDENIAYEPPHKRNLGMVFQNYALFPHMTVFENIAFPLKNRKFGAKETRVRVQEILALIQLEGYERRYPKQLSGGQQQRVSLGRSLVYNPRALLMDEPLGALDKKLREHMQTEIKSIQREVGITVIYVTHDQEEALNMSDRIAVMNLGKIEQVADPRKIYEFPETRFVADFIGEANLIEASIVELENNIAKVVVWNDLEMKAKNPYRKKVGEKTSVMIRPERIKILSHNEKACNSYKGVIVEASYVGELIRYVVDIGKDPRISMKVHNRGQEICGMGEQILIGWNSEDVLVV